jgi:hypothetical protein
MIQLLNFQTEILPLRRISRIIIIKPDILVSQKASG